MKRQAGGELEAVAGSTTGTAGSSGANTGTAPLPLMQLFWPLSETTGAVRLEKGSWQPSDSPNAVEGAGEDGEEDGEGWGEGVDRLAS